jgi:hypothetical protein
MGWRQELKPVDASFKRLGANPHTGLSARPFLVIRIADLESRSFLGGSQTLSPEILEPIRRQLRVAHGVLDVLVPEPSLQRPRIVPRIRQREPAAVPQHVRVNRKRHFGSGADPAK